MKEIMHLLVENSNPRKFQVGENFFQQGETSAGIYVVIKGRIKLSRVSKQGYESILCVRGPGNIFCPVPILDRGKQIGTATAMTDGSLLWIDQQRLIDLCQQYPDLLTYLQENCLHEVRHLLTRMEGFAYRSIRERLAFTLIDILDRQIQHGGSDKVLDLKQQEIAGLIGASRESVSRALSDLESRSILSTHRGGLVILDLEKLKLIAG